MTSTGGSILSAGSLRKEYGKGAALVRAVDDVGLEVAQGESVATSAAEVLIVAIAVAAFATIVPAIRGARTSTICALNDPAHPPRRRPALIALSA